MAVKKMNNLIIGGNTYDVCDDRVDSLILAQQSEPTTQDIGGLWLILDEDTITNEII